MSGEGNEAPSTGAQRVVFKRRAKGTRRGKLRTRRQAGATDDDASGAVKKVARAKVVDNALQASTRRRSATDADGTGDDEVDPNASAGGPRFAYASSGTAESLVSRDGGATALNRMAQTLDEAAAEAATANAVEAQESDGTYKGAKSYKQYTKAMRTGPVKLSQYVRANTVVDYQPDVCKDYKETGYCGYGHNCKFMHDRGDYKAGWELDKEWEERQAGGGEEENYEISSEDDSLPFACFICRKPFVHPIVTRCGHYFCERCALAHNKKSKKCFTCQEPTHGIFNRAKKIEARQRELLEAHADPQ